MLNVFIKNAMGRDKGAPLTFVFHRQGGNIVGIAALRASVIVMPIGSESPAKVVWDADKDLGAGESVIYRFDEKDTPPGLTDSWELLADKESMSLTDGDEQWEKFPADTPDALKALIKFADSAKDAKVYGAWSPFTDVLDSVDGSPMTYEGGRFEVCPGDKRYVLPAQWIREMFSDPGDSEPVVVSGNGGGVFSFDSHGWKLVTTVMANADKKDIADIPREQVAKPAKKSAPKAKPEPKAEEAAAVVKPPEKAEEQPPEKVEGKPADEPTALAGPPAEIPEKPLLDQALDLLGELEGAAKVVGASAKSLRAIIKIMDKKGATDKDLVRKVESLRKQIDSLLGDGKVT